jgi:hypothetical protein
MNIKTSVLFTLIFLPLILYAEVKSVQSKISCAVIQHNQQIAAFFPLNKSQKKLKWFKNKKTENYDEFMWIAEAGFIKNEKFVSTGKVMSYNIGSFRANKSKIKTGNIEDLLKDGWGSVYFIEKTKNNFIDNSRENIIFAKALDNEVMIFTNTPYAYKFILSDNPTHFKLKYFSINQVGNYSCITNIEK